MNAQSLIAYDIPAVTLLQTGRDAFHMLNDYHLRHLPVVDGLKLVGIISEEDIFNHKLYEPISEYDFSMLRTYAVRETEHVFEIIRVMCDNRLTVVPVVDAQGNYLGLIDQNALLHFMASTGAVNESGTVLVLEMNRRDYSMSTIARIIEEEDVKILSTFVRTNSDPDTLELVLKLNRYDLNRTIASLERHNYHVKETFGDIDYTDGIKERYDSLMAYLNV
ncbi:MAG: CBS domain-containing protein [Bacteroidetes bacterium]|nr:CBS domain-containing protein [Bacteroidota bacterium]